MTEDRDWTCPYCHTQLEADDERSVCPECGSVHHRDCWVEGGGCAVFGCPGTAGSATSGPGAQPPGSGQKPRSRLMVLAVTGSLLALVALGLVLWITVGPGFGGQPEAPGTQRAKPTRAQIKVARRAAARKRKQRRIAQMRTGLGFRWTADPGGKWAAVLPQGRGWRRPVYRPDEDETVHRTTLSGPGPDFIGVVTTPDADPTEDPASYTIREKRLPNRRLGSAHMPVADVIAFADGPDECRRLRCVKLIMSDGRGGGITVVTGSGSAARAAMITREFARNIETRY